MSLSEVETQEELNQELDRIEAQVEDEKRHDRRKAMMGWVTSLSIHAITILIASSIAFTMAEPEIEAPPVRVSYIAPPPPIQIERVTPKDRDIVENLVVMETEFKNDEKPVVATLELPVEAASEDEMESKIPKGREEAVSDSEMGGSGFVGTIGAGGPGSGMYGNRIGGGKIRGKSKMVGYGKPADSGVDAGLRWLKKHQSPNGMWSSSKYFQNCTEGIKCEPGKDSAGQADVAMTGYSLLCFLGAGYDYRTPNKYRSVVKNGVAYLLSIQKPDGLLGERNYEHAVAAMALVEAYGMTCDPELRKPAQKAIDIIVARQAIEKANDPYSALMWNYVGPDPNRNDISVSGWQIMALKSAVASGFSVGTSVEGAKKALERCWKAANLDWEKKNDPYKDTTVFPYTWNASTNKTERDHLSFVGATCAVFLGHKAGDIMLETLINDAEKRWIDNGAYKNNSYACYYLSLALFQVGGDHWTKALNTIVAHSIATQNKSEGCLDGSWDYAGQAWHGADTSRVLSTCYNILNLEVAYRYVQLHPEVKLKK